MRPSTSLLLVAALLTFTASAQVRETPISTAQLGVAELDERGPLAATDGTDFLAVWTAGLGDQLVISASAPDQREVALVATPGRPVRAAYARVATEPEYGYVPRVFSRDLV